jgi:hypothetical protein
MKIRKNLIYVVFAGILLGSCDDFLDKNPDNRASLDTPGNIASLLVSAYPEFSHVWFAEVMSDNATDIGPTAYYDKVEVRQSYYWERVESDSQDSPDGYWYSCYQAIASANHALEAIKNLETEGSYSQVELNSIKGEALLCRAYIHFMLVNLFAEHYDPATASSTPGIPYVTKPETRPYVEYTRQTVADVYKLIEDDIKEGFPLIEDELYGETPKWHFNRKAAATFISRYYLYRGLPSDWDEVIYYANIAIEDIPVGFLRKWLENYGESADVFATAYSRSINSANFLITSNISTACRAWLYRYAMDLNLARKRIDNSNLHPTASNVIDKFVFFQQLRGSTTYNCYFVNKYVEVFKRDGVNANYGLPYVMNVPIVAEEALFNQVEAEIMKENYNKVHELLDVYYTTRVVDYDSIKPKPVVTEAAINRIYGKNTNNAPEVAPHFSLTEKQQIYLKCAINIRATEFIHEGQRWFDIKRMHLPVVHSVYRGTAIQLERNDPRRVIPLPQDVGDLPSSTEEAIKPATEIQTVLLKDILENLNDEVK